MQVLVFVTEDSNGATTGPTLFVQERPDAILPTNPRGLEWRYFATISDQDELLATEGKSEVAADGYYISNRMI